MSGYRSIRGELQREIMEVLWAGGELTVNGVRGALPGKRRGAYTTVQTVLNRLAEGGLVERRRVGRGFLYTPTISEAEYAAQSLRRSLAGLSEQARLSALASLVGELGSTERAAVSGMAAEIDARRR